LKPQNTIPEEYDTSHETLEALNLHHNIALCKDEVLSELTNGSRAESEIPQ
jgi:hypothetical protein